MDVFFLPVSRILQIQISDVMLYFLPEETSGHQSDQAEMLLDLCETVAIVLLAEICSPSHPRPAQSAQRCTVAQTAHPFKGREEYIDAAATSHRRKTFQLCFPREMQGVGGVLPPSNNTTRT